MLLYNSSSPLPFFLAVCSSYAKNCKYAPHKRLLVVTCVGVWVVTVGSVSCLSNSQVITKKLPGICKFAPYKRLPVVTCVGVWVVTVGLVSCLGNSQVITKSGLEFVSLAPISCCLW